MGAWPGKIISHVDTQEKGWLKDDPQSQQPERDLAAAQIPQLQGSGEDLCLGSLWPAALNMPQKIPPSVDTRTNGSVSLHLPSSSIRPINSKAVLIPAFSLVSNLLTYGQDFTQKLQTQRHIFPRLSAHPSLMLLSWGWSVQRVNRVSDVIYVDLMPASCQG